MRIDPATSVARPVVVVLYLTHGPSARTSTAVLGTLVSLLLIGGLSAAFTALARLTGLDETTSSLIGALGTGIDTRGPFCLRVWSSARSGCSTTSR